MPRALTLDAGQGGRPGKVFYPLQVKQVPKPKPGPNQVLVRIKAAALNHRDLWARRHLYPGLSLENPLLADGAGIVIEAGPNAGKATPSHPRTPIGSLLCEDGTGQDYLAVHEDEVVLAPRHLNPVECAALPLCGLTGWRALVSKAGVNGRGKNVLVTGIGGGVALQVLQFAVAFGSNVYVTSADQKKIDKAIAMGARGGVSYRDTRWGSGLLELLPDERPYIDAVVDGAGGNLIAEVAPIMRPGGVIAQYGMTVGNKMDWQMRAVLANLELKGCTMGSKREFRDMVAFVDAHKIKPVVSKTVRGLGDLEGIETLFADMQAGRQFGKLVIEIDDEPQAQL
ncbi:hypothetical protein MY10362_004959 [Beauveria mimosiformis]